MDTYKSRWSSVTATEDRYDNLIAFPEGGMEYEDELLSADALHYAFVQAAIGLQSMLHCIDHSTPPEVTDIITGADKASYIRIQRTHRITWGQIGALLDSWQSEMMALSVPLEEIRP